jgi:hypothetical protein
MIKMPAVVPPISASIATIQKMTDTVIRVASTSAVGRPVTMVSPGPCACMAVTR